MGMSKDRLAASAGVAAVTVALSLAVLKFLALQATGSLTVAASLADSAIDAVASMTGLAAILYASRPADEDHAFGHGSAEDLAALVSYAGKEIVQIACARHGTCAARKLLVVTFDQAPELVSRDLCAHQAVRKR